MNRVEFELNRQPERPKKSPEQMGLSAPLATLFQVFEGHLPENMPLGRDIIYVSRDNKPLKDRHLARQFADPLALIGIAGKDGRYEKHSEFVTPRLVNCENTPSQNAAPTLSSTGSSLLPPSPSFSFNPSSIGHFLGHNSFSQDSKTKLAQFASDGFSKSWHDEAPIVRILATLIAIADDSIMMGSSQLMSTFAYDGSPISIKTQVDSVPPDVHVKAWFCNIDEYFGLMQGEIRSKHFGLDDLEQKVIIIPLLQNEMSTEAPLLRAMVNTTMDWWYARLIKKISICSSKNRCEHHVVYATPLAALLKLDSQKIDGEFRVLFVSDRRGMDTLKLRSVTIGKPDGSIAADIAPLITRFTTNVNEFPRLRDGLKSLLKWYANHDVGGAFGRAQALVAETCFQLPMPKMISGDKLAFGYLWGKYDAAPHLAFKTIQDLHPVAEIEGELNTTGCGRLGKMLNDFVLRFQTPLGLLQPGRMCIDFDFTSGKFKFPLKPADFANFYHTNEADGSARLAIALGPMVVLEKYKFPLMFGKDALQHLQELASLMAGIAGWAAMQTGYTMFDICRFSTPDDPNGSLLFYTYDKCIADPITLATSGRVTLSADSAGIWRERLDIERYFNDNIVALGLQDDIAITDYDGWPLPAWFIIACRERFTGERATGKRPPTTNLHPMSPEYKWKRFDTFDDDDDAATLALMLDTSDATSIKYMTYGPLGHSAKQATILCDLYSYKARDKFHMCTGQYGFNPIIESSCVVLRKSFKNLADHIQHFMPLQSLDHTEVTILFPSEAPPLFVNSARLLADTHDLMISWAG
jgi:hypothetical protein